MYRTVIMRLQYCYAMYFHHHHTCLAYVYSGMANLNGTWRSGYLHTCLEYSRVGECTISSYLCTYSSHVCFFSDEFNLMKMRPPQG